MLRAATSARRVRPPAASAARLARAWALAAGLVAACGSDGGPLGARDGLPEGFPRGDAFVFGNALDAVSQAPVEALPVTLTPSGGLPLEQELASPLQAEVLTNERGEFAFGGIAAGAYVLFVRFDGNHRNYGEVVGVVSASAAPFEVRLLPAPVALSFLRPAERGTVAPVDTALLSFRPFRLDELRTLAPGTRPLAAVVELYTGRGGGSAPEQPRVFRAPLTENDLALGRVRVPIEAGSAAGTLRLEAALELEVVYRDPGGGPAAVRRIEGRPIQAARR